MSRNSLESFPKWSWNYLFKKFRNYFNSCFWCIFKKTYKKYVFFMHISSCRVFSARFLPHCLLLFFKWTALLLKEIWGVAFKKKIDLRDGKALDQTHLQFHLYLSLLTFFCFHLYLIFQSQNTFYRKNGDIDHFLYTASFFFPL